jgi:hypothetical protein
VLADGCLSNIFSKRVETTRIPDSITIVGDDKVCAGLVASIEVPDLGAGEQLLYWIVNGDTFSVENSLTFQIDSVLEDAWIQVIPSVNNCIGEISDSFMVEVIDRPSRPSIIAPRRVCDGDDVIFSVANPMLEYVWITPAEDTFGGDSLRFRDVGLLASGDYQVYSIAGNCFSSLPTIHTLDVIETPEIPEITSFDEGICVLTASEIEACISTASATPGASYYWYNQDRVLLDSTAGLCIEISDLSAFEDGTNALLVEARRDQCVSNTSIPVNVEMSVPSDSIANAGLDQAICDDRIAQIAAVLSNNTRS